MSESTRTEQARREARIAELVQLLDQFGSPDLAGMPAEVSYRVVELAQLLNDRSGITPACPPKSRS